MNTTLGIIDYLLNKEFKTIHTGKWNRKHLINNISIYDPDCSNLDVNILYINLNEHPLPDAFEGYILTLRDGSEDVSSPGSASRSFVLFCNNQSPTSVFNRILSLYHDFITWQSDICLCQSNEEGLRKMFSLCMDFLDMLIYIVDAEYNAEFFDSPATDLLFFQQELLRKETGKVDVNMLYYNDPDFDKTFETRGLQLYAQYDDPLLVYYYNIISGDKYTGRILFLSRTDMINPALEEMMTMAAERMSSCYLELLYRKQPTDRKAVVRAYIDVLISETFIERGTLVAALGYIGWSITDSFLVLKCNSRANVVSPKGLTYHASTLEGMINNSLSVIVADSIYCLVNTSQTGCENLAEQIDIFSLEYLFNVGISKDFHDATLLSAYCRQAEAAMEIGYVKAPEQRVYDFSDLAYDYMFKKITEDYPPVELCHPAIRILSEHDKKHPGTGLGKTLKTYLACGLNATEAADAMGIHRTSFLYRMRKIEKLTQLNLRDSDTLLYLFLSYKILE